MARFCSSSCGVRVRDAVDRVKYRDQQRQRAVWLGEGCERADSLPARCRLPVCGAGVDGQLVGGDSPTAAWHLGHWDGEGEPVTSRASNLQRVSTKPPSGESEARPVTHAKTVAVVWGSERPAYSIGYCEPMWPGDSGLTGFCSPTHPTRTRSSRTILGSPLCAFPA